MYEAIQVTLLLLEESKDTPIYMQVLFNVLMGLRRQEINAVKYSDVDYIIPEEIPELVSYMNEVMPKKSNGDIVKNSVQDIIIDKDEYLPKGMSQKRNKT